MKARPMTIAETKVVFNSLASERNLMYYALFALMEGVGARISEALALKIEDLVDEDGNVVKELSRIKLKARPAKYKKYISSRIIPEVSNILSLWLRYQRERFGKGGSGFVFTSKWSSKPIDRRTAWKKLKTILITNSIPRANLSLHSFRKTFARVQYEAFLSNYPDDPLKAVRKVQTLLGHSSIECTTMYLDLEQDNPQKHVDKLSPYLGLGDNIRKLRNSFLERFKKV